MNYLPEIFESVGHGEFSEGESEDTRQRLLQLRASIEPFSHQSHIRESFEANFLSSNPYDRIRAASFLLHDQNMDLFAGLFQDSDPRVRCELMKNHIFLHRHFPKLYEELYRDTNPDVRAVAAETFMLLLHRPDLVKRYLTDPEENVRAGIAKIWNNIFGSSNLAYRLLFDPSLAVQAAIKRNPWINYQLQLTSRLRSLLPRRLFTPKAQREEF